MGNQTQLSEYSRTVHGWTIAIRKDKDCGSDGPFDVVVNEHSGTYLLYPPGKDDALVIAQILDGDQFVNLTFNTPGHANILYEKREIEITIIDLRKPRP